MSEEKMIFEYLSSRYDEKWKIKVFPNSSHSIAHTLVLSGYVDFLKILINDNMVDIDYKTEYNTSVLELARHAVSAYPRMVEVIELLEVKEADQLTNRLDSKLSIKD